MSRGTSCVLHLLAGAVAFAAAQAVLFVTTGQSDRPTIDSAGWFLNSGTGIAAMAAVVAVASVITAALSPTPVLRGWAWFVGGGVMALAAAVFLFGPGTIFPIVIAVGAAVIGTGAFAGVLVARLFRR